MQNAKYALPGIRVSFTEVAFLAVFCFTQRNYGNEETKTFSYSHLYRCIFVIFVSLREIIGVK